MLDNLTPIQCQLMVLRLTTYFVYAVTAAQYICVCHTIATNAGSNIVWVRPLCFALEHGNHMPIDLYMHRGQHLHMKMIQGAASGWLRIDALSVMNILPNQIQRCVRTLYTVFDLASRASCRSPKGSVDACSSTLSLLQPGSMVPWPAESY